ncbi:unnamed protein product, partial [Rotaria magnacalcarata]
QQTLEYEESLANNNESLGQTQSEQQSEIIVKSEAERELRAAQIVQSCLLPQKSYFQNTELNF